MDHLLSVGRDDNDWHKFVVHRLEAGEWKKIAERKWYDRVGHSCELLGNERLAVLGGWNHQKSVDVLNLNNLKWAKVTRYLITDCIYIPIRGLTFLVDLLMTSQSFTTKTCLSYSIYPVLST